MYEFYVQLFDRLVPDRFLRAIENLFSAWNLNCIILGVLAYHIVRVLRAARLEDGPLVTRSRQQPAIAAFWQIAVVALLAANMNIHMILLR